MIDEWKQVSISDISLGVYDGPHATPPISNDGPIYLGIGNITEDGHLDLTDVRHIAETDFTQWTRRVTPRPGDIVFTYEATLNRYAIIPDGFRGCLGRRTALIRPDPARIDTRFLFYSFFGRRWRDTIEANRLSGATVDRIPIARFPQFPLLIPTLPTQGRIASILGAYDDLIELNRRRITLLQEIARRLFEEWFVHFWFPGHEGRTLIELSDGSLPRDWEWRSLDEVCMRPNGIQTGPFGSQLHQADYLDDGVPVVMPKNLINLRVVENEIARISEAKANELGRHRMRVGDVVYGRRGDIGRRAYISAREDGWFCGTGCLRLRPDPTLVAPRFFFDALGHKTTLGAIQGRAQGATMPNLSAGVMAGVPVMVPPLALQRHYERNAEPVAQLVANFEAANTNLARSRDLLLPRLISGELSVSGANRELETAA